MVAPNGQPLLAPDGRPILCAGQPTLANGVDSTGCCPECTPSCEGDQINYAQAVLWTVNVTYIPWISGAGVCLQGIPLNTPMTISISHSDGSVTNFYGKITSLTNAFQPSWNGNGDYATTFTLNGVGTWQYYSDATFSTPTTTSPLNATLTVGTLPSGFGHPGFNGCRLIIATDDENITVFDATYEDGDFDVVVDTAADGADPDDPHSWPWYATGCSANSVSSPEPVEQMSACVRFCLDWECFTCGDENNPATFYLSPFASVYIDFEGAQYSNRQKNDYGFGGDDAVTAANWGICAAGLGQFVLTCAANPAAQPAITNRSPCSLTPDFDSPQQTCLGITSSGGGEDNTCCMATISCGGPNWGVEGINGGFYIIMQGGVNGALVLPTTGTADLESIWNAPQPSSSPPALQGSVTVRIDANACRQWVDSEGDYWGVPVDFPNF